MQKTRLLNVEEGFTLKPILPHSRLGWGKLALIYASCMASIPVLLVGFWLAGNYSLLKIILIIAISALVVLTFDSFNSVLGTDTGLPASLFARGCLGNMLAKIIVSVPLVLVGWGWFGIQLAMAIKSLLVVFGFENLMSSSNSTFIYLLLTPIVGTLFAFTPITKKLARYGITNVSIIFLSLFCLISLIIGIRSLYFPVWPGLLPFSKTENPDLPLSLGCTALIGLCASQFVMLSDYSRFARKIFPDSLLIPLVGVTPAQVIFAGISAMVGLMISFQPDFFSALISAGVPRWAFILLFFSQWNAARLVVIYSAGLAGASLVENPSYKARQLITFMSVVVGTMLVALGFQEYLILFLIIQSIVFAPIGALIALDHLFIKRRCWQVKTKANLKALFSLLAGWAFCIIMFRFFPHSYALLGSTIISLIIYSLLNFPRLRFNECRRVLEEASGGHHRKWNNFLLIFALSGLTGAVLFPIIFPTFLGDLLVLVSLFFIAVSTILYLSGIKGLTIEVMGLELDELPGEGDSYKP
ncbi:hypothetical protein [Thermanaerothrix sp.]|uniref:hypothetical protein n=1 Tax=Thermanaerothrix sp. TaxID=2972675 RepID=UPI003C7D7FFF